MTEKSLIDADAVFADIDENYKEITEKIAIAAAQSGRKAEDISFMAVTKTVRPIFINHAIDLGIGLIGENKVQELLSKTEYLKTEGLKMNIIGHLQSNKVKKIINTVDMIQSVDSISIAEEISKQAVNAGTVMKILLEVNIGNEESKTGFNYEEAEENFFRIREMKNITVCGFMAVPPVCETECEVRKYFAKMNGLFTDVKSKADNNFSILSLGMSSDYVPAILEGANQVRIGSALFGARRY